MVATTTGTWNLSAAPHPWRTHQDATLQAFEQARAAGRTRMYAALPPGGGKTLVGLEIIRRLGQPAIVLCPNTAIQQQWLTAAAGYNPPLPASSTVGEQPITVVTYQALISEKTHAVHKQGRALLASAHDQVITVMCDEIHHLLGAWGDAVGELADLARATVVGLTGTPPVELTATEAAAMEQLFGSAIHQASTPALVREGYLAPWRELTHIVAPTDKELRYLQADRDRARRFMADLITPGFADVPFDAWLSTITHGPLAPAARTVANAYTPAGPDPAAVPLSDLAAVLTAYLAVITDVDAIEAIRDALPALGYRATRNGVQGTTSPANRCLAHSHAKHHATAQIITTEWSTRREHLRALVLADFENYTGTPEAALVEQNLTPGSARHMLAVLAAHPVTRALSPVLVTGKTVACSAATAPRLIAFINENYPHARARCSEPIGADAYDPTSIVKITGKWTSRDWVAAATAWFTAGHGHILIGTRALLGEGWDAPRSNVLVDLTTAATAISAAQARGRVLRTDANDPFKTAHVWSVAAVTDDHHEGRSDLERMLRKHDHVLAVSDDGVIVSGREHLPEMITRGDLAGSNEASWEHARRPDITHALWHIGAPYRDDVMRRVAVDRLHEGDPASRYARTGRFRRRARTAPHAHTLAESIAACCAEGLHRLGLMRSGYDAVRVWIDDEDRMHTWVEGTSPAEQLLFLETVQQALTATPFGELPALTHPHRQTAYITWHAIPDTISKSAHDLWRATWAQWVSTGNEGVATTPGRAGNARTITLWN